MRVRTALQLINQVLDEVLAEQEGDFDTDSRWCVKWFDRVRVGAPASMAGPRRWRRRSIRPLLGLERAGVIRQPAGKVQLLKPRICPTAYDPAQDARPTVWEAVLHLSEAAGGARAPSAAGAADARSCNPLWIWTR